MALKFNDIAIQAGITEGFYQRFVVGTNAVIKLYSASVTMPTTPAAVNAFAANSVTALWTSPALTSALVTRSGGRIYLSGVAQSAAASATGTVAWASIQVGGGVGAGNTSFVTDAVSVTDPTAIIQLNTLSAVSGAQLTLSAFGLSISGT